MYPHLVYLDVLLIQEHTFNTESNYEILDKFQYLNEDSTHLYLLISLHEHPTLKLFLSITDPIHHPVSLIHSQHPHYAFTYSSKYRFNPSSHLLVSFTSTEFTTTFLSQTFLYSIPLVFSIILSFFILLLFLTFHLLTRSAYLEI